MSTPEKAKAAIEVVLRRIQRDPRIAYYFDPITDSYEKLVSAHCELNGLDEAEFRKNFEAGLKFEAPVGNGHEDLVDALYRALPFIEEAKTDPHYKTGAASKVIAQIRAALTKAGTL